MLELIDHKCVDNYETAIRIIWSVKSGGGEELKEKTHEIMSKSIEKYTRKWVNDVWEEYDEGKKIGIGTALHYAKLSNSKKFMEIIKKNHQETINFNLLTEENLGNIFITLYGEDFIYYNGKNYKWSGVYWNEADREEIIQVIYDKLLPYFIDMIKEKYNTDGISDATKIEKLTAEKKKALQVVNMKMSRNKGTRDLAETIKIKLRKQTINEIMDNNWNLFVFNNKVYDLEKAEFVKPRRDQYMTLSTGYNYEEQAQKDINRIEQFLKEIIEDEKEREFYIRLLSTALEGKKSEQYVIANGEGGNGKSLLHECIGNALGNYFHDLES